jgi:hypothetical protein
MSPRRHRPGWAYGGDSFVACFSGCYFLSLPDARLPVKSYCSPHSFAHWRCLALPLALWAASWSSRVPWLSHFLLSFPTNSFILSTIQSCSALIRFTPSNDSSSVKGVPALIIEVERGRFCVASYSQRNRQSSAED